MADKETLENAYQAFVSNLEAELEMLPADEPDKAGRGQTLLQLADNYRQPVEVIKAWISRGRDTGLPIDWERVPITENGVVIQVEYLRFVTFDRQRAKTYYEHGRKVIQGIAERRKKTAQGALDRMPKLDTDQEDNVAYYDANRKYYEQIRHESFQILELLKDKDIGRQTEFDELDPKTADLPTVQTQTSANPT